MRRAIAALLLAYSVSVCFAQDSPQEINAIGITNTQGERVGFWQLHFDDGHSEVGWYRNNKANGVWVIQIPGESLVIASYKEGIPDGMWAIHSADGHSDIGPFKDGLQHGVWVLQRPDGHRLTGSYEAGKQVGKWTRSSLGFVADIGDVRRMFPPGHTTGEIYFVEDQPIEWKIISPGGLEAQGLAIDDGGHLQGKWQFRLGEIREEVGMLEDSVKQGVWEITWLLDDTKEKGTYVDGRRHGEWVVSLNSGSMTAKGNYEHGWRSGEWVIEYEDGQIEIGDYLKGLRHGRWRIYWPDGMEAEGNMSNGIRTGRWRLRSRFGWEQVGIFVEKQLGEVDISVREGDWRYFRDSKPVDWQTAAEKGLRFYDVLQEAPQVELFVYNSGGEVYMGTLLADYKAERKENIVRRIWAGRLAHGEWMERISWLGREQDRAGAWALEKATYFYGVMDGRFEFRKLNGDVTIGAMRKNEKSGMWITLGANGSARYVRYALGIRQGLSFLGYADGTEEYGRFVQDKRHGDWVVRLPSGAVRIGRYENGRKVGRWKMYSVKGPEQ